MRRRNVHAFRARARRRHRRDMEALRFVIRTLRLLGFVHTTVVKVTL